MRSLLLASLFASLSLSFLACGGAVDGASSTGSSGGSSGAAPAPSSPTKEGARPPAGVVGVFHLSRVDATNLEIRADGFYKWSIEGCDFGGGQCGYWKTGEGGKSIILDGGPATEWSHDGSFKARVTQLRVTPDGQGGVEVQGITTGAESFRQTWEGGRVCAVCGGSLGPTGQEACDAPLPDICI